MFIEIHLCKSQQFCYGLRSRQQVTTDKETLLMFIVQFPLYYLSVCVGLCIRHYLLLKRSSKLATVSGIYPKNKSIICHIIIHIYLSLSHSLTHSFVKESQNELRQAKFTCFMAYFVQYCVCIRAESYI